MGREVRRVPKNWQHPKDENGNFIPLLDNRGTFDEDDKEWSESYEKWQQGMRKNYLSGKWVAIDEEDKHLRYSDYAGARPSPDDYMPNWLEEERTHLMMYENTTEGTPISPAFETPEELARWLVENNASAFGDSTATFEQWLSVCKGGFAPSLVLSSGVIKSGVEAISELQTQEY